MPVRILFLKFVNKRLCVHTRVLPHIAISVRLILQFSEANFFYQQQEAVSITFVMF